MKTLFYICITIVVFVIIIYILMEKMGQKTNIEKVNSNVTSLDIKPYANSQYGFQMHAPKNWRIDESEVDTVYFINTKTNKEGVNSFSANINVSLESSTGLDLNNFTNNAKITLPKSLNNYKAIDDKSVTVNGVETRMISGTFIHEVYHLRNLQMIVVKNNKAYIVTGTALESTWDQYKDIIESSLMTFSLK